MRHEAPRMKRVALSCSLPLKHRDQVGRVFDPPLNSERQVKDLPSRGR